MSKIKWFAALAVAALALPGFAVAAGGDSPESAVTLEISDDVSLTVTGEVRVRMEYQDNLVDFSGDDDYATDDEYGFIPSRFRVGFKVALPKDLEFVMDVQNTSAWGEDGPDRANESLRTAPPFAQGSGAFLADSHRDDLGVYQAYFSAKNIGGSAFSVSVGRQEFEYGNELMLGNNDFYGGTSNDGVKAWFDWDNSKLVLIYAKLDEQNTGSPNGKVNMGDDDTDLWGGYYTMPEVGDSKIGFDAYALYLRSGFDGGASKHDTGLHAYYLGGRVFRAPEKGFHFTVEGVYNFGDCAGPFCTPVDEDEADIAAWAAEAMAGYTFDVETEPDIHGGYSFFSGDDDPFDDDQDAFFQVMPDVHIRGGFADLFLNYSNLQYWQIGYSGSYENHSWGLEFYQFMLDQDFGGSDDIGQEVDVYYNYEYSKNLSIQVAYAFFMADDVIEDFNDGIVDDNGELGIDTDDAMRLYTNVQLKF